MNDDAGDISSARRHGKAILIGALASVVIWLFLSDGYHPKLGIVGSLYHSMTLYEGEWFCREDTESFSAIRNKIRGLPAPQECWSVVFMTKYFILASLILALYGFLIGALLLRDPIPFIGQRHESRMQPKPPKDEA